MKQEVHKEGMKVQLANAMKICMRKMPVEKVTVRQIVEVCGTTRQTFYRHFQDKYDLINWYFERILKESFEHMGQGQTVYEGLVHKFRFIEQEKLFFAAAFQYDQQNSLREHDFQLIKKFYKEQIESKTRQPLSRELEFLLEMYCQGSVYMTIQWVLGQLEDTTVEKLAQSLVEAMPPQLASVFHETALL